jgi:radical SAM superfamily enzyme YgiQ (UPF0313 family)
VPLNLLWPATYLQQAGYDVEILDSQTMGFNEILGKLSAPLIGIGYYATSTHLMERVAAVAKQRGAVVVVGGQAATPVAHQILERNPDVDFVVRFDGEEALLGLARLVSGQQLDKSSIPNLAYRHKGEIVLTPVQETDLASLPMPDRRLAGVNMERYFHNFMFYGSEDRYNCQRITNVYTRKGCPYRGKDFGCSFCARIDLSVRSKTARQVYNEYKYLVEEFGVDYICDDSDSWINKRWMRELVGLYEEEGPIPVRLRVYGDPRHITPDSSSLLKALNVDSVLLGVESGDPLTLKLNGKNMLPDLTLRSVDLLAQHGIRVADAYVLGLIGETRESLNATIRHAEEIHLRCDTLMTYWNLILPLPGTPIWDQMMAMPELKDKHGREYQFEISEVRQDYLRYFCNLGEDAYAVLCDLRDELQQKAHITVGEYLR